MSHTNSLNWLSNYDKRNKRVRAEPIKSIGGSMSNQSELERMLVKLCWVTAPSDQDDVDKVLAYITANYTTNSEVERFLREARIDELEQLIPEPVAEMVNIDYEDELKRTYDDIHNRIADLKAQQEEV